ncbi:helix-turn-helix domain-containing protein [Streptomyces orinoci]|uniref:Helix-turn-helix transcriptional regulator n=1 Tax=Streptomyces orinoci TaxID=67339 RepID=A0ABV3K678_STRON|nr:helix-turn-helix transcriptional regulator [Streptomyces orinoci]
MANAGGVARSRIGWGFFGAELKRRREEAGFTQRALGERVFCSGAYIGQIEAGVRRPQLELAKRIDIELGTGGFFARVCEELINSSPDADWFAEVSSLEGMAVAIQSYSPTVVPGLLQTPDYARAVFVAGCRFAMDEEIESWVAARLARQCILDDPTRPMLWSVLDEGVIRRPVGGRAVMREQLLHLTELMRRRRLVLQVLPYAAGASALDAMLKLMSFEDAPPLAYSEGVMSGSLLDDPAQVARCRLAYDLVRAAALSPEASVALIESVAEEYAGEDRA